MRPGRYDLILASGDLNAGFDQIAIRPDLTREAMQPMVPTTFTATNLGAEEVKESFLFLTAGTTRTPIGSSFGWDVRLAPASVLRSRDQQYIELFARRAPQEGSMKSSWRARTIPANVGGATSVTLPDPLGDATFERSPMHAVATWSTLPAEYDSLSADRVSFGTATTLTRLQLAMVSRSYVRATGAVDVRLDFRDIPGFRQEWHFLTDPEQFLSFSAQKGSLIERGEELVGVSEAFLDRAPTSESAVTRVERLAQLRRALWLERAGLE